MVEIHLQGFPGFFLSFLGPGFLKVYYRAVCRDQQSICFVSVDNDQVINGFVVGAVDPGQFYKKIFRRDFATFALGTLKALLARPVILSRLIRTALKAAGNGSGGDSVGLFSIAVSPSAQGGGIGGELVGAFLKEAAIRNCSSVTLTTDGDNNERVHLFYRKWGFRIDKEFVTAEGRRMCQYVCQVESNG